MCGREKKMKKRLKSLPIDQLRWVLESTNPSQTDFPLFFDESPPIRCSQRYTVPTGGATEWRCDGWDWASEEKKPKQLFEGPNMNSILVQAPFGWWYTVFFPFLEALQDLYWLVFFWRFAQIGSSLAWLNAGLVGTSNKKWKKEQRFS